jgi:hypothetical protein
LLPCVYLLIKKQNALTLCYDICRIAYFDLYFTGNF